MNHNPVVFEMKNLRLVIGIIVILAIVCSPALAIKIADWRQSHSSFPEPKIGHPYDWRSTPLPEMKSKLPTIIPTTTPTPAPEPIYYGPSPNMSDDVYWELLAKFWEWSINSGAVRHVDGSPFSIEELGRF
jgi:hypothetical protein